MTMGNEAPKQTPKKPDHTECQHGGAYCVGRADEARRIYNRDNPSGEYDIEWIPVEYWECPNCGAAWDYEVD